MKIGYFVLKDELREEPRMRALLSELESASYEVYEIKTKSDIRPETDLVLSMGGDGTFLSAAPHSYRKFDDPSIPQPFYRTLPKSKS